jgi:hypothetical protein
VCAEESGSYDHDNFQRSLIRCGIGGNSRYLFRTALLALGFAIGITVILNLELLASAPDMLGWK